MSRLDTTVIEAYLDQEARAQGVDPAVAKAILHAENHGLTSISTEQRSDKKALGIMQVIPETLAGLRRLGLIPEDLDYTSPQGQIKAGVAVIKDLNNRGITDPLEVAVAYNGGNVALAKHRAGQYTNPETEKYKINFSKALGGNMAEPVVAGTDGFSLPPLSSTRPLPGGSSSSRTSTSHTIIPKDLEEGIMSSMNRAAGLVDQLIAKTPSETEQIARITKEQTEATRRMGVAESQAAVVKGDIEAAEVTNKLGILNSFGININATEQQHNQAIISNLATIKQMQAARGPLADQIANLKGTNPLQDPAGWLVNNFKAMGLAQTHNAIAERENAAIDTVNQLQSLASRQAAIQPADVTESIQLRSYAEAQFARAKATAQIAQTESLAQQHISRQMIEQLNFAQADFGMRVAAARMFSEKFSLSQGEAARTAAEKEVDDQLAVVNMYGATIGLKPFNKTTIKMLPQDTRDSLVRAAVSGSYRDMGEAVSSVHELIGDVGFNKLAKESPVLGSFLTDAIKGGKAELDKITSTEEATKIPNLQLRQFKTDKDRLAYGISLWQKTKEGELAYKDYSKLSADNPMKVDFARSLTMPELENNSVTQFVKGFSATAKYGAAVTDHMIINNAIAEASLDPKKVPKLAADIAEYYRTMSASKAFSVGLSQYGWKQDPKKFAYPVLRGRSPIDMFSTQQVEQQLTVETADAIISAQQQGMTGTMGLGVAP